MLILKPDTQFQKISIPQSIKSISEIKKMKTLHEQFCREEARIQNLNIVYEEFARKSPKSPKKPSKIFKRK